MDTTYTNIGDSLSKVYSHMDKDGLFPSTWLCAVCNEPLDERGRYAGIYTGLCSKCERSGSYISRMYVLDGALQVSYPPSCPSWRRDRETYIAYVNCVDCNSTGKVKEIGKRQSYCRVCLDKYMSHPVILEYSRQVNDVYRKWEVQFCDMLCSLAGIIKQNKSTDKLLSQWAVDNKVIVDTVKGDLLDKCAVEVVKLDWLKEIAQSYVCMVTGKVLCKGY